MNLHIHPDSWPCNVMCPGHPSTVKTRLRTQMIEERDHGGAHSTTPAPAGQLAGDQDHYSTHCSCPGRADGRHGMLCEAVLRAAFGSLGDAPPDVLQMLRSQGKLVTGLPAAMAEITEGPASRPGSCDGVNHVDPAGHAYLHDTTSLDGSD